MSEQNPSPLQCRRCEGKGEIPATPGQPGDGPMPCPDCVFEYRLPLRDFLTHVRMETASAITRYICAHDLEADPADVHEDVREALWPGFQDVREYVEGPMCERSVAIGVNTFSTCDLLVGHSGPCHPSVGTPWSGE